MTTAIIQAGTHSNLVEMDDQGLKENRWVEKLMKVKVDIQSEELDSIQSNTRPLIQDRDPKGVNKNLKVNNVICYQDLNDINHT